MPKQVSAATGPYQIRNKWMRDLPAMPAALFSHAAVLGENNKKVYVIGGNATGSVYQSAIREFDPVTSAWTTKTAMNVPLINHSVAAQGDYIYVLGGYTNTPSNQYVKTVKRFDTVNNTWDYTRADMPATRAYHAVTTTPGYIWAFGGYDGSSWNNSNVWRYDISANTWSTSFTAMPVGLSIAGAAAYNGYIYILGGYNSTGSVQIGAYQYDVTNDTWATKAAMPDGIKLRRWGGSVVTLGRFIYIGPDYRDDISNPSTTTLRYDPELDKWERMANFEYENYAGAMCAGWEDNFLIYAGGYDNSPQTWYNHFMRYYAG